LHVLTRDTPPMKSVVENRPPASFSAHYSRTHFFVCGASVYVCVCARACVFTSWIRVEVTF